MAEQLKEKFPKLLKQIEADVFLKDKQAAATEFKLSTTGINNYLRGKIENEDLALELIIFFKARILHRQTAAA